MQRMQVTDCTAKNALSDISDPEAVIHSLQAALEAAQTEIAALKQQLDWFKRQLFGRKSEKRIIEHPDQLDLSALLGDAPAPIRAGAHRRDHLPPSQAKQRATQTMSPTPACASALTYPLKSSSSPRPNSKARRPTSTR